MLDTTRALSHQHQAAPSITTHSPLASISFTLFTCVEDSRVAGARESQRGCGASILLRNCKGPRARLICFFPYEGHCKGSGRSDARGEEIPSHPQAWIGQYVGWVAVNPATARPHPYSRPGGEHLAVDPDAILPVPLVRAPRWQIDPVHLAGVEAYLVGELVGRTIISRSLASR
jgi:hypothetical protein